MCSWQADIYGPSETILGALNTACEERGRPKPQIFTKLVPNIMRERPTTASVEAAIRRSCAALRVDALDLVQLHWYGQVFKTTVHQRFGRGAEKHCSQVGL